MTFEYIDDLIEGIDIDLEFLKRKTQRNKIMLLQHKGNLSVNNQKIGNSADVTGKFINAMRIAHNEGIDLFMTPEYSCPWESIKEMLRDDQLLPPIGKLWLLGCESISLVDLTLLKNEFENEFVEIHFDQDLENTNLFVDPSCYVFKASLKGIIKTFVIIQFKTFHMGVWQGGDVERDNIILGRKIYVIKNNQATINLITLICSEAMNFKEYLTQANKDFLEWEDKPYYLLHPQFNPDPYHRDFIDFRSCVFSEEHKEIISLNWQLQSKVIGSDLLPHCNARSGFYINSNQLNLTARRVNANHKKGLYYFNNKKNRHSYFLSSQPHLFIIENSPLKISEGVNPQQRRDGPEVTNVYECNNAEFVEIDEVDDTQIEYYQRIACTNEFLCNNIKCVIDKERLVSISSGTINKEKEWWKIENIDSVQMDSRTEINRRITVARNESSESLKHRSLYCEAIAELEKIISVKDSFPPNIEDITDEELKIGFTDDSIDEGYRFNVLNSNGESVFVTICYIGSATEAEAHQTYVSLRKLFSKLETKDIERVVVYYKRGLKIIPMCNASFARITETNDYDDDSIAK